MRQRRNGYGLLLLLSLLALVAATATGCSNTKANATKTTAGSGQTCSSPDERAGVTTTTINVGGMASRTNPLNYDYGEAFDGARAYFAMVNSQGGVFGRKLNLVAANDVGPIADQSQVSKLLSQHSVFAVAPVAALLFPGASLLAEQCVPTFGWNINSEWADGPSLFGDEGSSSSGVTTLTEGTAWLAKKLGTKRVAVLGYGISESTQCVQAEAAAWKRYPDIATDVFNDAALPYPLTDVSQDVSRMKQAGVDLVIPCVDTNAMVTIAREMQKQNYHPVLDLTDGYYNQVRADPDFGGAYVTTYFTPLEVSDPPAGLRQYETWMRRTGGRMSEQSIFGWASADMLVTGIKAAGPNFTRSSVVAALNRMTDFTANGVLPSINWTIAHTNRWSPPCFALSEVQSERFVPKFGPPGKPFVCFPMTPPPGPLPTPTFR